MLRFVARHSTVFMPLLSLVGLLCPSLANGLLPFLPQILFFLMFFTLLGMNQRQLIGRLATPQVWRFAVLQSGGMCLVITLIGAAVGLRGDWLLAVAGLAATAPLFGSGAIAQAVGLDALLAMAMTIAATLVMPVTLLLVLMLLGGRNATLDMWLYTQRLLVYIVLPMMLALAVRHGLPKAMLERVYPKIAQFNILLVLCFPLGLMGGFRQSFDANPWLAMQLLGVAILLALVFFASAFLGYRRQGRDIALMAAIVCSGRNVLLAYTITLPFMGALFLPLMGAFQLPAFCLPLLAKSMLKSSKSPQLSS